MFLGIHASPNLAEWRKPCNSARPQTNTSVGRTTDAATAAQLHGVHIIVSIQQFPKGWISRALFLRCACSDPKDLTELTPLVLTQQTNPTMAE